MRRVVAPRSSRASLDRARARETSRRATIETRDDRGARRGDGDAAIALGARFARARVERVRDAPTRTRRRGMASRDGTRERERAWRWTTARTRARAVPQRWLASMTKKFNDAKDDDDASTSTAKTTKEDLGRATWTFLHTFAAQYPDEPTRRQERDARELIMILTRAYPCGECAAHFAEIVRVNPPDCSSGLALQRWMCAVHNEVNASLGKAWFDCAKVDGRWSKLDCDDSDASPGCSLEGRRRKMMR